MIPQIFEYLNITKTPNDLPGSIITLPEGSHGIMGQLDDISQSS